MAPTIEYPAQQCDASPKSLHIVLFYCIVVSCLLVLKGGVVVWFPSAEVSWVVDLVRVLLER